MPLASSVVMHANGLHLLASGDVIALDVIAVGLAPRQAHFPDLLQCQTAPSESVAVAVLHRVEGSVG